MLTDADADGILDFRDFNSPHGMAELVIELSQNIDFAKASLRLEYSASNPAAIARTGSGSSADPFVYTAAPGLMRLWKGGVDADGKPVQAASRSSLSVINGGHYVAPQIYTKDQLHLLGLDSTHRKTTLWVEGINPSLDYGDGRIVAYVDPDGTGPLPEQLVQDSVRITVVKPVDFDMDSDNGDEDDDGDSLESSGLEDSLEEDDTVPAATVMIAEGDVDGDNFTDFEDLKSPHRMAPAWLELMSTIDVNVATLKFTYSAAPAPTEPLALPGQMPATGTLRLWKKKGAERTADDYIPSGTPVNLAEFVQNGFSIPLYVEGIRDNQDCNLADRTIVVSLDLDGDGPMAPIEDKVIVRCLHGKAPVRVSEPDDGIAWVNSLEAGLDADDCTIPDGVGNIAGSLEAREKSEADGLSLDVHFGRPSLDAGGVIKHGYFLLHGQRPTPALFDVKNIRYVHPMNMRLEVSAGRKVAHLCMPDNERIRYHFTDGSDANATAEARDHQRLRFLWLDRRTEENGTKGYRLRTPEGSYIRFAAIDAALRIYEPVELVTAAGRHFTSGSTAWPSITRTANGSVSSVAYGNNIATVAALPVRGPGTVSAGMSPGFVISCGGSVWTVKAPDNADLTRFDMVHITHQRGNLTENTDYEYDWREGNDAWVVTSDPDGADPRIMWIGQKNQKCTMGVIGVSRQTSRTFSIQEGSDHLLTAASTDPAGFDLKTQFEYQEFKPNNKADVIEGEQVVRKLPSCITSPSGAKTEVSYDGFGRIIQARLPWRDTNGGQMTSYDYAPIAGEGDVLEANTNKNFDPTNKNPFIAPNDNRPRTITETIGSDVISRTWFVYKFADNGDPVCITVKAGSSGAGFNDPKNIRTTIVSYGPNLNGQNPTPEKLRGMMKSLTASNGLHTTSSSRLLDDGQIEIITETRMATTPGGPTVAPRVPKKSTRTVTLLLPNGLPIKETQEVWLGVNTQGEDQWVNSGCVVYAYDDYGRLLRTYSPNNTSTATSWTLYGVKTETGPDGLSKEYVYNRYHELLVCMEEGKTTTFAYDKAGSMTCATTDGDGQEEGSVLRANITNDAAGRQKTIIAPNNILRTFNYDPSHSSTTLHTSGKGTEIRKYWLDGLPKSVSGSGVTATYADHGVEDGCQWTKTWVGTATDSGGSWIKTTVDFLGRPWKTSRSAAGNTVIEKEIIYDDYGRPKQIKTKNGGQVKPQTLFEYDASGPLYRCGLDKDNSGILEPHYATLLDVDQWDSFVQTDTSFENGSWKTVTTEYPVLPDADGFTPAPLKGPQKLLGDPVKNPPCTIVRQRAVDFAPGVIAETETTGIDGNVTTETTSIDNGNIIRRTTVPGSATTITEIYHAGRLKFHTDQFGLTTSYEYDGFGRLIRTVDPRGNATVLEYNDKDQMVSSTDAAGNKTTYEYDAVSGEMSRKIDPLGGTVNYEYDMRGNVVRTWGGAVHPMECTYDTMNRPLTLATYRGGTGWDGSTWPANPGVPDTTSWTYDDSTGLTLFKTYSNGNRIAYGYDGFNRLTQRTWGRSVNNRPLITTYAYDALDRLTSVAYSDGTTPNVNYTYDSLDRCTSVTDAVGSRTFSYNSKSQLTAETITGLYDKNIGRSYDAYGRLTGVDIAANSYSVDYGYDASGRRTLLTAGNGDAWQFSYLSGTNLLQQIAGPHGISIDGAYENSRNLLTRRQNKVGAVVVSAFDYLNDALGRRTRVTRTGTVISTPQNVTTYSYNASFELIREVTELGQNLPKPGLDFSYDRIGNRLQHQITTDGINFALAATYQPNSLNQYQAIQAAGEPEVTNLVYDDDGNMTAPGDGWAYQWDAENRLVRAERTAATGIQGQLQTTVVDCKYDYMSRRVEKTVTINGAVTKKHRFVYDDYQLIQELDGRNDNALIRSYVWRDDHLASIKDHASGNTYYYLHDANKNVTELVNGAGAVVAHYEYTAFGETSKAEGVYAQTNPFRFSNEYWDDDLGLAYYNYRYYSPKLGRWISRDPIGEQGGLNLHGFCGNAPTNATDALGLDYLTEDNNSKVRALRYTPTNCLGMDQTSFFVGTINQRNPQLVDIGGRYGHPIRVSRDRIQKIADETITGVKTMGDLLERLGVFKQVGPTIQPPSFTTGLIPFYGAYQMMCYEAERGSIGGVLLAGGFMATDCFMVGSLVKCTAKVAIGGGRAIIEAGAERATSNFSKGMKIPFNNALTGTNTLGEFDAITGRLTVQRIKTALGKTDWAAIRETLRHESVHKWFYPTKGGKKLLSFRRCLDAKAYSNSRFFQATEEIIAQRYASGSWKNAWSHAFNGKYELANGSIVTKGGYFIEAGIGGTALTGGIVGSYLLGDYLWGE